MINIICKGCGWRIPFMKKTKDGFYFLNIDMYDLVCINCGRTIIKLKNGFKFNSYRDTRRDYRIKNGFKKSMEVENEK